MNQSRVDHVKRLKASQFCHSVDLSKTRRVEYNRNNQCYLSGLRYEFYLSVCIYIICISASKWRRNVNKFLANIQGVCATVMIRHGQSIFIEI